MNAIAQFRAPGGDAADAVVLRAAVDACPSGLAVVEDGLVLYANRAFAELFGYFHSSAVQGRALTEFLPAPQFPARTGGRSSELETSVVFSGAGPAFTAMRGEATSRRIGAECSRLGVPKRNLLVVCARDAGKVRPKEEPSKESGNMEAMGRLVGGVAHDFNNLLTGILLYCDLLIAGLDPGSPLRAYVEEIRRVGGHSTALIQQLLAVARPRVDIEQALSWNEIVSGMRNLLTRLLGENIELATELANDAQPVAMNPVHMRQIALNLLLNARDAMPEGGRIMLATKNGSTAPAADSPSSCDPIAGEAVELTVTDTGCGMNAETRSHLFEPFFTTKHMGHGLGIAMVGRMVKEQCGTVEVESEVGKGTRVTVRLPRAPRKPEPELE